MLETDLSLKTNNDCLIELVNLLTKNRRIMAPFCMVTEKGWSLAAGFLLSWTLLLCGLFPVSADKLGCLPYLTLIWLFIYKWSVASWLLRRGFQVRWDRGLGTVVCLGRCKLLNLFRGGIYCWPWWVRWGCRVGGGCFLAALSGLRVYSLMGLLVPILASLSTIRNFF